MNAFNSEIRNFADSRETSYEIAAALIELFPETAEQVWDAPTDDQSAQVISRAWELADAEEDALNWGAERIVRA
ncbi:MAG: hypothetical protein ABF562_03040 [Gluconobacter japonicus]|uniref:hypothetical protein n=1 Tax=Gluconobacter japonicus TaxID=376620 RepID=UPI0039E90E2E